MNYACYFTFVIALTVTGWYSAAAQDDFGPGFDPTPVTIPRIRNGISRTITPMDLLALRDLHGIQISPNGMYVAFIVGQAVHGTNSYRSGLFVVGTRAGSHTLCLGTAGPPHWSQINEWEDDPPVWSLDSRYIYYRVRYNGSWQVWQWDRRSGRPTQVTSARHNVRAFQLTADGMQLILEVEKPFEMGRNNIPDEGILFDGSFVPGQPWSILKALSDAREPRAAMWIHDLAKSSDREATQEEYARYGPPKEAGEDPAVGRNLLSARISPDGSQVAYQLYVDDVTESPRYSYPIFVKPARGGRSVLLTPGVYGITNYWWGEDSRSIYYEETLGDGHSHRLVKAGTERSAGRRILMPAVGTRLPGFLAGYSVDRSATVAAAVWEADVTPGQIAVVDLPLGRVRNLVDVNPEFRNLRLSRAERIDVTSRYGDNFHAYSLVPANCDASHPCPLVVTTYRSNDGFLRGGVGDEYPIHVLAAQGFAVLAFDVGIGRNHRAGEFESARLNWESPMDGMHEAISRLSKTGRIDPLKIGITGLSRGAVMVEYAISHTDMFRTAIDSGPAENDPLDFYIGSDGFRDSYNYSGLNGWPERDSSERWHAFSTALNANHVHAALLSNASDSEYVFELQLITSLRLLGKPVELIIYPNELHIKNQPTHRYEIYVRNVDWLRFWLMDQEIPDPVKADQYKRWRELRKLEDRVFCSAPNFCRFSGPAN